jgi:hypothetical protein
MRVHILLACALLAATVAPASAQSVKLSFNGGRVDLSAENATVRTILNEWARVGGTRIVNAERLAGPPITVEFRGAYEQQVLEALLRSVSGYIVGPRLAAASSPNTSGFDRIVILANSTAPRTTPVTPAVSRPPGPQPLRRFPQPVEDDPIEDPDDEEEPEVNVPSPGRPETPADLRRRLGQLLEADPDDDDADEEEPAPAPAAPANPFGVTTGAARPGVITPVPAARPGAGPGPGPGPGPTRPAPEPATQP